MRFPLLHLFAAILMCAKLTAQTVPPTAPIVTDIENGCVIDLPADWVPTPPQALSLAFAQRSDAILTHAFHPAGSRPTVVPYALVYLMRASMNPSDAEIEESATMFREYYVTAIRPPSNADRASGWKRATVSPCRFDYNNRQFAFNAVIAYDDGTSFRVDVSGVFNTQCAKIITVWTDAATSPGPEIAPLLSSIRVAAGPLVRPRTFGESVKNVAQIGGVLLLVLIAGVQGYVWYRERRERQESEMEFTA